jgi:hypothetical protein
MGRGAGGAGARTARSSLERFATLGEFVPARWQHHLHHRRQRLPARPAAAPLMARLRQAGAGGGAAGDPVRRAQPGDAAQRAVPARHQPAPAGRRRHPAKAPVRRRYRVFYDPACVSAPRTREDYLAADHITVVYEPRRALDLDHHLAGQGIQRRFRSWCRALPACRPSSAAAAAGHGAGAPAVPPAARPGQRPGRRCPARPCRCTWSGMRGTRWMRRTGGCGGNWKAVVGDVVT